jgi:excisionase family DNA binding protein
LERRWISIRECSVILSLHEQSVYRLVYQGKIKAGKVGRNLRVDLKALNEQLERGLDPSQIG